MKCPLFAEISKHQTERGFLTHIDCLGNECAWYDKGNNTCVVVSIKDALRRLGQVVSVK